ncbi:MAG: UMP kinase [Planctomycetota bacterium]|jgi:uridylate kinase
MARYKRVLLKASGQSLGGVKGIGLDFEALDTLAKAVAGIREAGVELAVVLGGGNFLRGETLAGVGVNRETADYMGMVATVVNALALQDRLEARDIPTRVCTAIHMGEVAEPYIRRRAIRHLEKGRIVILAGGTGNPHFSTDTAAALRAAEIGAEALFKATRVDGVYSADPEKVPDAEKFEHLTYMDVLNKGLRVMDSTAVTLCMEKSIPVIVFNLTLPGNIEKAVAGEPIGTRIDGGEG